MKINTASEIYNALPSRGGVQVAIKSILYTYISNSKWYFDAIIFPVQYQYLALYCVLVPISMTPVSSLT